MIEWFPVYIYQIIKDIEDIQLNKLILFQNPPYVLKVLIKKTIVDLDDTPIYYINACMKYEYLLQLVVFYGGWGGGVNNSIVFLKKDSFNIIRLSKNANFTDECSKSLILYKSFPSQIYHFTGS